MNNKDIYLIGEAYKKQVLENNNLINPNTSQRGKENRGAKLNTLQMAEELLKKIPLQKIQSNPELKTQVFNLNRMVSELAETENTDSKKIVDLSLDIRDLIQYIQEKL